MHSSCIPRECSHFSAVLPLLNTFLFSSECFLFSVDDLAPGVQAVTSLFHRHRWLEEHKKTCTIYSASLVSSAQDSSLQVTNFTWWTIKNLCAKQTMKQQKLEVNGACLTLCTHVCIVAVYIEMYFCNCGRTLQYCNVCIAGANIM